MSLALDKLTEQLARLEVHTHVGRVVEVAEEALSVSGLAAIARLGDHLRVLGDGTRYEVTALHRDMIRVEPLEVAPRPPLGAHIRKQPPIRLRPGPLWLGQRIDGFGRLSPSLLSAPSGDSAQSAAPEGPILIGHHGVDHQCPLVAGGLHGVVGGPVSARHRLMRCIAERRDTAPVIWVRLGAWTPTPVAPRTVEMVGLPNLTARGLGVTLASALEVCARFVSQGLAPLLVVDGIRMSLLPGQNLVEGLTLLRLSLPAPCAALIAMDEADLQDRRVEAVLCGLYWSAGSSQTGHPAIDLDRSWSFGPSRPVQTADPYDEGPDPQSWSVPAGTQGADEDPTPEPSSTDTLTQSTAHGSQDEGLGPLPPIAAHTSGGPVGLN